MANRNPFLDPLLLIPVMALSLGLFAAWRYWDNPDFFAEGPGDGQGSFGDLLSELDVSQRDTQSLAADIDSSDVLDDAFSESNEESADRISPGRLKEAKRASERKKRSAEEILKLLRNTSKGPTGGGNRTPTSRILDSDDGSTRLSLGQFRADGSFQGRSLSLSPSEQELRESTPQEQFRAAQPQPSAQEESQATSTYIDELSAESTGMTDGDAGRGIRDQEAGAESVPGSGASTWRSPLPPSTLSGGAYGRAPRGPVGTFTTPGYGATPPVPSLTGAVPLVPATSGPGYNRGIRNYQLNGAPPAAPGGGVNGGLGVQGSQQQQPLRSVDGARALSRPQPTPSNNISGRSLSSFSNPYRR